MEIKRKVVDRVENTDVIKKTLMALITVAKSKTSDDYAWSSAKTLLRELESKYDFLRCVRIKELKSLSYTIDDIKVSIDINDVEPRTLGKALQDLIELLKKRLGKKAGYFFLQEFKQVLGKEYYSIIRTMGVDLRLIELKRYIECIDKDYTIRDDKSLNIAFIEKNN